MVGLVVFQVMVEVSPVAAFNSIAQTALWPIFDLGLSILFTLEVLLRLYCFHQLEDKHTCQFFNTSVGAGGVGLTQPVR